MKPESKFWKEVKENLPNIHWTRFENRVAQGVPDCYGISDGISIWVELKVIRSNKIVLSPFQKSWNFSHSLQGGRNFIMAKALAPTLLYIFPGCTALSIGSIARLPHHHWVNKHGRRFRIPGSRWQRSFSILHCRSPKLQYNSSILDGGRQQTLMPYCISIPHCQPLLPVTCRKFPAAGAADQESCGFSISHCQPLLPVT